MSGPPLPQDVRSPDLPSARIPLGEFSQNPPSPYCFLLGVFHPLTPTLLPGHKCPPVLAVPGGGLTSAPTAVALLAQWSWVALSSTGVTGWAFLCHQSSPLYCSTLRVATCPHAQKRFPRPPK